MSGEIPWLPERPKLRDKMAGTIGRVIGMADMRVGSINTRQVEARLEQYSAWRPNVNVLQIGANDGKRKSILQDCIKRFGWRGVLIEPVEQEFLSLQDAFKSEIEAGRITVHQGAVSDRNGKAPIYRAKPFRGNNPLPGQESLDPMWLARRAGETIHRFPSLDLVEKFDEVDTYTIPNLKRFLMTGDHFDYIDVNAGSLEGIIMDQMLENQMRPDFYQYNHHNMSMSARRKSHSLLIDKGYKPRILDDYFTFAELQ